MRKGDLVKITSSHGEGVSTFASPQRQRWFPNGACGVVLGKTCPEAKRSDWHRQSLYEVLIGDGVHTMFNRDLQVIDESR
jgi:hypothetical protein